MQGSAQGTLKKSLTVVIDNKLKGAYAESDLRTGVIRVNKKRHSQKGYKRINPNKDGHEDLASTLQHELLHFKHPNMKEMNVRKLEKRTMAKMGSTQKKRLLDKLR